MTSARGGDSFFHAETFCKHLRVILIQMAGLVSAFGLVSVGYIWLPLTFLLLIPGLGVTLVVSDKARRLSFLATTFGLASTLGFLVHFGAFWLIIDSGRYSHSALYMLIWRSLIFVSYGVVAWATNRKVKSLRTREGIGGPH